jgi:integrase/recombinase XerD
MGFGVALKNLASDFSARKPNDAIAAEYLAWQRDSRRRSPTTLYQYAAFLDRFLLHLGSRHLAQVTLEQLEEWLHRPRGGRGHGKPPAASTLQGEIAILRGLWRYAIARGLLSEDPTVLLHSPTVRNENPKPIDDRVWEETWARSLPDEALITLGLGYFCGLRRAEITNLRGSQVDTRRRRLVGFTRKGGGDDVLDYGELIGLVADDLPELCPDPRRFLRPFHEAVVAAGAGLLMPWSMTSQAAQAMYRVQAANDPALVNKRFQQWGFEFTPHQLRHSFVTNLLRCDVPLHLASRLANHSSIQVTMRYVKVGGSDLAQLRKQRKLRDLHSRDRSP